MIDGETVWYVQVAALVIGHVIGLTLAHDRAIALYKAIPKEATRSQYWMLLVMICFTTFGLFLLSQRRTGERLSGHFLERSGEAQLDDVRLRTLEDEGDVARLVAEQAGRGLAFPEALAGCALVVVDRQRAAEAVLSPGAGFGAPRPTIRLTS